jgi:hypothetical protein
MRTFNAQCIQHKDNVFGGLYYSVSYPAAPMTRVRILERNDPRGKRTTFIGLDREEMSKTDIVALMSSDAEGEY